MRPKENLWQLVTNSVHSSVPNLSTGPWKHCRPRSRSSEMWRRTVTYLCRGWGKTHCLKPQDTRPRCKSPNHAKVPSLLGYDVGHQSSVHDIPRPLQLKNSQLTTLNFNYDTERGGQVSSIAVVLGSYLGLNIGYPDWSFPWFSLGLSRQTRHTTSNSVKADFFHILPPLYYSHVILLSDAIYPKLLTASLTKP